jgi:hypothetical protein
MLERLLRQFLQYQITLKKWTVFQCLNFLFNRAGDDGVLAELAAWKDSDETAERHFQTGASRVLERKLPHRAIALSLRTMADYDPSAGRIPSSTFMPWSLAFEQLSQKALETEEQIADLLGISANEIIVDWPHASPVKENPDIWVTDPSGAGTLVRVNRYFDSEQLANAYRDVKMTGWVFCEPDMRERVAAATAYILHENHDLFPGSEALRRAKVSITGYSNALTEIGSGKGTTGTAIASNLLSINSGGATIRPPPAAFLVSLDCLSEGDAAAAAARLSASFAECGLSRFHYDDLQAAVLVLKFLVLHCKIFNRALEFRNAISNNEDRFQTHLVQFLEAVPDFAKLFTVEKHTAAAAGYTDLIIRSRRTQRQPIIVELKSDLSSFEKLYDAHAGQSLHYAERDYGRVTFLYCQYKSTAAVRLSDTLVVRRNVNSRSPLVTICVAQHAFADRPSDGGATTIPAQK